MIAYLSLCRVWNALFAAAVCVYCFFIEKAENYYEVAFISLSIFFLVAFANTHNDVNDVVIDRINRPERPMPSYKIGIKKAYLFLTALFFLTILFSLLAGIKFAVLFIFALFLCITYNHLLKFLPLVGNFTVAALTALPVLIPMNFSILAFFAFMLTFSREIVKDIEDMEGDRFKKVTTLPLLVGVNLSLALAGICLFQCLVVIFIFKPILLAGVLPFVVFSAIFAFLKRWRLSQTMLKLSMLGGLFAFLLA